MSVVGIKDAEESPNLFDYIQHHCFVPLPGQKLQQLFEIREKLGTLLHLLVDLRLLVLPF